MVGVMAMETSAEINVCYEGDYRVFTNKHTVILWSCQLDYMVPVCAIYCLLTHFLLIFKATLSISVFQCSTVWKVSPWPFLERKIDSRNMITVGSEHESDACVNDKKPICPFVSQDSYSGYFWNLF